MYTENSTPANKQLLIKKIFTMETKKIAGIVFNDEGITITRKYSENIPVRKQLDESLYIGKFLELAKRLAKCRMAHCYKSLHANLTRAKYVTPSEIVWEDGHFQVSVWEALEGILKLNDVRELNVLQSQQIIRSILLNSSTWVRDYNTNTWEPIKDNKELSINDDFKLFIIEYLMFCRWNNEIHE